MSHLLVEVKVEMNALKLSYYYDIGKYDVTRSLKLMTTKNNL